MYIFCDIVPKALIGAFNQDKAQIADKSLLRDCEIFEALLSTEWCEARQARVSAQINIFVSAAGPALQYFDGGIMK